MKTGVHDDIRPQRLLRFITNVDIKSVRYNDVKYEADVE